MSAPAATPPLAPLGRPDDWVPADVPGWCDFAWLYAAQVVAARPGARLVEVGSWLGKSAITMARMIRASGKDVAFGVVDTFRGSSDSEHFAALLAANGGSVRAAFEANLARHGVSDLVEVCEAPSVEAARRVPDGSLDFVFIDADHAYESVCADIDAWLPKVRPGGTLAGHDYHYMGVAAAVAECLPAGEWFVRGSCWVHGVPGG